MEKTIIIGAIFMLLFGCTQGTTYEPPTGQINDHLVATKIVTTNDGCEVFCAFDRYQGGISCDWEKQNCKTLENCHIDCIKQHYSEWQLRRDFQGNSECVCAVNSLNITQKIW